MIFIFTTYKIWRDVNIYFIFFNIHIFKIFFTTLLLPKYRFKQCGNNSETSSENLKFWKYCIKVKVYYLFYTSKRRNKKYKLNHSKMPFYRLK